MITLKLEDKNGKVLHELSKNHETYLALKYREYEQGEVIVVETDLPDRFVWIQVDETFPETLALMKNTRWEFPVIFDEGLRKAYSPKLFSGNRHYIKARYASEDEKDNYRNLALNPHDQKDETGMYPHAFANVETRNDATFFARNAIDGIVANEDHGSYPYQSWGINQQEDAALTVDFGDAVEIDKIAFVLRGDYPHDSFWTSVSVEFDDRNTLTFKTTNSMDRQFFEFEKKVTTTVTVNDLQKNEDDSPFPALTELEVYGRYRQ